ncbi:GNAT family N-acetyltransferase [Candidatus Saccharibacteria bacterium]|nr:GNAT family N-acetyltransferase [Candidatus Saccharibacteria bacterium]
MNAKLEKFDKENYLHVASALNVARWSEEETGSMLPITPQDICEHEYGVLATGSIGLTIKTAGYIAMKEVSPDGKVGQIGAFVVNPEGRGQGLGARLLDYVLKWHKQMLPNLEEVYSYVNHKSLPLFLAKGGVVTNLREPPYRTNCVYEVDLTHALERITPEGSAIL